VRHKWATVTGSGDPPKPSEWYLGTGDLRFDRTTVCFESHPALLDISLAVAPGETAVAYGASANGKTVLLKTAIGLLRADEGRVSLLGRKITDCRKSKCSSSGDAWECCFKKAVCSIL
jgi:ABC-type transporter Mla maintaining outer membrane lipid asymmetry ATPase subunit MlaF